MAKRKNPYRRAAALAALARLQAREMTVAYNADDSAKLQQGRVRSTMDGRMRVSRKGDVSGALTSNRPLRPSNWEGRGKTGKVVAGKFKFKRPGTQARFAK